MFYRLCSFQVVCSNHDIVAVGLVADSSLSDVFDRQKSTNFSTADVCATKPAADVFNST